MTTYTTYSVYELYPLINEESRKVSESKLFQNKDFATTINDGMVQLRLWARDRPSPSTPAATPPVLAELRRLTLLPGAGGSNPAATLSAEERRVRAAFASERTDSVSQAQKPTTFFTSDNVDKIQRETALEVVSHIQRHFLRIYTLLRSFNQGGYAVHAKDWSGAPCPPALALLAVAQEFGKEVRRLLDHNVALHGLLEDGPKIRKQREMKASLNTEKNFGDDEDDEED